MSKILFNIVMRWKTKKYVLLVKVIFIYQRIKKNVKVVHQRLKVAYIVVTLMEKISGVTVVKMVNIMIKIKKNAYNV